MVPQRKGNSVEAGDLYITWCLVVFVQSKRDAFT